MFGFEPLELIARLLILGFALPLHEFAHAFAADRLGDNTPAREGRLTLSPLAHLEPIGSLLILVAGFGWARPVMVNPYMVNRRTPYGMVFVALAGPVSNLLLALLLALPFRFGLFEWANSYNQFVYDAIRVLVYFIFINLVLALFNMIPLPPLDGEKVLGGLLPGRMAETFEQMRPYGPMLLLALVFVLPRLGLDVLGVLIYTPALAILQLLVG